ncbi:MAG: uncharacterized protein KVP18_002117 [Porospora cf. gigantea A]|uniref:uncharacterized protein n=1 Tax=Porospora cf. gigantea A TaxID=2853593 RepID=UPI003559D64A|nr:MAG: hypothetical protein KVP18_002117 [Porospora cf. gigantea A]
MPLKFSPWTCFHWLTPKMLSCPCTSRSPFTFKLLLWKLTLPSASTVITDCEPCSVPFRICNPPSLSTLKAKETLSRASRSVGVSPWYLDVTFRLGVVSPAFSIESSPKAPHRRYQ